MTIRKFLSIVEIRTKVISVSTYVLATLYALWSGTAIRPATAVLLAFSVLCVDMGTTAFNTFYDYMRRVDTRVHNREPDKVLVHQGVAPGHALVTSLALYAVAAVTGVVVAWMSVWWIIPAGAVSLLVGFLYNGGPYPISRTPLGELFAGGFLGSVLFLIVVGVHAGGVDRSAVIASLPSTLMIASVLAVNNTCDVEGDRAAGRRTVPVLLGRAAGEALIYLPGIAAFTLLMAMAFSGGSGPHAPAVIWSLPPLPAAGRYVVPAGLVASIAAYVAMHRRGYSHATKRRNMIAIIRVVGVYSVTYGVTLIAGVVRG